MSNVSINMHSSIKLSGKKVLYFDPFKIIEPYGDADIVFITHSHFDHFSPNDIKKIMNKNTLIVLPFSCRQEAVDAGFPENKLLFIAPGETIEADHIKISAVPAYNKNRDFHPKKNEWVGYLVDTGEETVYVAGDTDALEENYGIECDIAFIPVGGTFTMDVDGAVDFVSKIKAGKVIPTHYGSVAGKADDGKNFAEKVDGLTVCELLI